MYARSLSHPLSLIYSVFFCIEHKNYRSQQICSIVDNMMNIWERKKARLFASLSARCFHHTQIQTHTSSSSVRAREKKIGIRQTIFFIRYYYYYYYHYCCYCCERDFIICMILYVHPCVRSTRSTNNTHSLKQIMCSRN